MAIRLGNPVKESEAVFVGSEVLFVGKCGLVCGGVVGWESNAKLLHDASFLGSRMLVMLMLIPLFSFDHVCMHVCMYVCMYVRTYVRTYVCM